MSRLTVLSVNAHNDYYFRNILNYIVGKDKTPSLMIGAANILLPQKRWDMFHAAYKSVYEAMEFYGKEDYRLGIHLIIEFAPSEREYLDGHKMLEIGYEISAAAFSGCMTLFGVHEDTDELHLDMFISTVDLNTGTMYGCNMKGWTSINLVLQSILMKYMPREALGGIQVSYGKEKRPKRF